MKLKLPVSPDFFHCPPLTHKEVLQYREMGRQAALDLVEHSRLEGGPLQWKLHSANNNMRVYSSRMDDFPVFCATTEINATLEDMYRTFMTTTTEETRAVGSKFLPSNPDKVRLYNITLPTPQTQHHYLCINWVVLATPFKGLIVKYRDICYLEQQEDFVIDGKRAWVRAYHSVEVAACPNMERQYGLVRAEFNHSGFVYIETDTPGILKVLDFRYCIPNGRLGGGGSVRDFIMFMSADQTFNPLKSTTSLLRACQLSQARFLREDQLVPKSTCTHCAVCQRKFSRLQGRTNCRRCGEVVCRRPCSSKWSLTISNSSITLRICTPCSEAPVAPDAVPMTDSEVEAIQIRSRSSTMHSFLSWRRPWRDSDEISSGVAIDASMCGSEDDFSCYSESCVNLEDSFTDTSEASDSHLGLDRIQLEHSKPFAAPAPIQAPFTFHKAYK